MTRPRILIAKVGLDGHDAGARTVAKGLVDAGFEVVYTGIRQTPMAVVAAAVQEDVDVVGLSLLSGAHMYYVPRVIELLGQAGLGDVMIVLGGVIPREDIPALTAMGVSRVFLADSRIADIAVFIRDQMGSETEFCSAGPP
jgi:methylmalonyl-CoA mutase, C-terminal domain